MADEAQARFWLRLARIAGIAPLVLGLLVFAGWLLFGSAAWMAAGLVVIGVGVALVILGLLALLRYRQLARPAVPSPDVRRATAGTLALLGVNFPVAAVLTVAAIVIQTVWIVDVINATGDPAQEVRIVGGGVDERIERLAPGDSVRRAFWVDSDGVLELHVAAAQSSESSPRVVTIEDYVTTLMGGRATVTLQSNGEIEVQHEG